MLSELSIFQNLKEDELLALESASKEMPLAQNEFLFHAGESRSYVYVLLEGEIKIFDPQESEESIAIVEKGQPLSEEALMDEPGVHSKNAQALVPSKVLIHSASAFKGFMVQHPAGAAQILRNIAQMLATRLKSSNRRIITIYRIGKILGDPHARKDIKILSEKILSTLLSVIKATMGLILIRNPHKKEFLATAFYGYTGNDVTKILEAMKNSSSLNDILGTGRTVSINNDEEIKKQGFSNLATKSLLISPMVNEETFGAIILADKKDPQGFSTRNQILLSIITKEVTLSIAEAKLRQEKQAEEEFERVYIEGL